MKKMREREREGWGIVDQEMCISKDEVSAAIKRMKSRKVIGPVDIPVEEN